MTITVLIEPTDEVYEQAEQLNIENEDIKKS
jgi:hypothetical protein